MVCVQVQAQSVLSVSLAAQSELLTSKPYQVGPVSPHSQSELTICLTPSSCLCLCHVCVCYIFQD